jgi:hypothetical protein
MDQELQEQRRRAQLNPQNTDILWAYIRQLERSLGGEDVPLYAVLTDGETVGSPCRYSSGTAVPYKDGDDLITLYGRWMDEYSSDDPSYYFPGISRAWIITESTKKAGEAVWMDADGGRDSIGDAVTSAMLSLYKNMAVKTIVFPQDPRCDVDDGGEGELSDELQTEIYEAYEDYRKTKDGGLVRMSMRGAQDTMDLLLGAWCEENWGEAATKEVTDQSLTELPYSPRQLLVKPLAGGNPFRAILYKQGASHVYPTRIARMLLCDHCTRKPDFRCMSKPDEVYAHNTIHQLDDHLLLEIDGTPIANEDEFQNWLDENAYSHLKG